jgi:hypothetical protein
MKKILSLALALALMLALTACAKPENSEASEVESTQESNTSTTESRPLREGAYVFADAIEFEIEDSWTIFYIDNGSLVVEFDSSRYAAEISFVTPAIAPHVVVDEGFLIGMVNRIVEPTGGEVTLTEVVEITIDGQVALTMRADIKLTESLAAKMNFWICKTENDNTVYVIIFFADAEDYDVCFPQAQALVDSIRFI